MPDDIQVGSGSDDTPDLDLDPASESDQSADVDLLGSDDAQSGNDSDLGDVPPVEGATDFLTDADKALLMQDPERGAEHVVEKVHRFVKSQQKAFTKRMTKIAREAKQKDAIVNAYRALDARLGQLRQTDPEFVDRFVEKIKGTDGAASATRKKKPPETVDDLLSEVRSMIREEIGGLTSKYQEDRATSEVDAFLKKAGNDRLTALRDRLIETKKSNPGFTLKQAIAVVDPDLLGDLLFEARQRRNRLPGGQRELSSTSLPARKKYSTLDEAFNAAVAKHGDPSLRPFEEE